MTGKLLGESGKLRKVLGLQGDTERCEVSVDVQVNFGEERRGVPPCSHAHSEMEVTDESVHHGGEHRQLGELTG